MRWTDPLDGRPLRHARVWLDGTLWRASLIGELDLVRLHALAAWIGAGRAVVVRRRDPGFDAACCLGVAFPVSAERLRIGFAVDPLAIVRVEPPLELHDVLGHAPMAWRPALQDLLDRAKQSGTTFHVYGSLAWQAISGERCVRPRSDLDLLWSANTLDEVDRVLRLLTEWESVSDLRADGELLLPDGGAIAWRELKRSPNRVLVKHQDRVSLQPAAYWRSQYLQAPLAQQT